MEIDEIQIALITFVLLMIAITINVYYTEKEYSEISINIFTQINSNTTNKEIIDIIQTQCSLAPWYIEENACIDKYISKYILQANP